MSDDRPSIAELQRLLDAPRKEFFGQPIFPHEIRNAAPVLLEVAAAALRYRDSLPRSEIDTSRCEALDRALCKVRK